MRKINELHDTLIVHGADVENSTLEDFLKWAFSDLCDDGNKGVFVEWLVAKLLKIPTSRRCTWSNSDLISRQGTKIEIKSSSYWQSWKAINSDGAEKDLSRYPLPADSRIRYAGLTSRDAIEPYKDSEVRLKSDLYIFCFQNEKNYEIWNAMDLSQWEFYLVPAAKITSRSVNLLWLKINKFGPLDPTELNQRFREFENVVNEA